VELFFHFAPACTWAEEGGGIVVSHGDARVALLTDPRLSRREVVVGQEDPPLGWYSPGFDRRIPSPTLVVSGTVQGEEELVTRLRLL
jgi:hypothetical protein